MHPGSIDDEREKMEIRQLLDTTAFEVEAYITEHLFDPQGIMYCGIDVLTGKPFTRDFITPIKVPQRAAFDSWSYWTYEDSVLSTGLYLDGLVLKYEVTGDRALLERAGKLWTVIKSIYSCSQVHGIGSFLRPYGGFAQMDRFMEPLGTDQASPLFSGLYRYLPHVEPAVAHEIRDLLLKTLTWYEQQGFAYFYYKSFIHSAAPEDENSNHTNSYYLPAIAWAAAHFPSDARWQRHLQERLGYFRDGRYRLSPHPHPGAQFAFCWGSDLDILHQLLGVHFDEVFTASLLAEAYAAVIERLAEYNEPGTVRRCCPESADPHFTPTVAEVDPAADPLGFAYFRTRHHGRYRPRHEIDVLLALGAIGYRIDETTAQAGKLMALFQAVPTDFTPFLAEDYDCLPETVHLYARSVGVEMVQWWRNYWLLHHIMQRSYSSNKFVDGSKHTDQ